MRNSFYRVGRARELVMDFQKRKQELQIERYREERARRDRFRSKVWIVAAVCMLALIPSYLYFPWGMALILVVLVGLISVIAPGGASTFLLEQQLKDECDEAFERAFEQEFESERPSIEPTPQPSEQTATGISAEFSSSTKDTSDPTLLQSAAETDPSSAEARLLALEMKVREQRARGSKTLRKALWLLALLYWIIFWFLDRIGREDLGGILIVILIFIVSPLLAFLIDQRGVYGTWALFNKKLGREPGARPASRVTAKESPDPRAGLTKDTWKPRRVPAVSKQQTSSSVGARTGYFLTFLAWGILVLSFFVIPSLCKLMSCYGLGALLPLTAAFVVFWIGGIFCLIAALVTWFSERRFIAVINGIIVLAVVSITIYVFINKDFPFH